MSYFVHVSMRLDEETPEDAVRSMVEQMVMHGLRRWTYQVDSIDSDGNPDDVVGFYSGHGVAVTAPNAMTDSRASLEVSDDDAALLAYAAQLNNS